MAVEQDSVGSVVGKVTSSGAITGRQSFGPFGEEASGNSASGNGKGFTGRDRVGNGLLYFRNRMYSPLLGRFISEDPTEWGAGPNFFAYCGNDPINFNDSLGLAHSDPFGCGRGDACSYGGGYKSVPYGRPEDYEQRRAAIDRGMLSSLTSIQMGMDLGNHGSPTERLQSFGGRNYFKFTGGRGSYGGGQSRPRVRHFTGESEIKGIKGDKFIKKSEPNGLLRSHGRGVDVEAQPFGPTRRGENNPFSPKRRLVLQRIVTTWSSIFLKDMRLRISLA